MFNWIEIDTGETENDNNYEVLMEWFSQSLRSI